MKHPRVSLGGEAAPVELGILGLAAMVIGGVVVLLFGGGLGGAVRRRRHREAPPAAGSIPTERHQNVGAAPAR